MPTYSPDVLAAMSLFAMASSLTPGPNNTMLLASGANFGVARTVPHLLGVSLGFCVLVLAAGFGVGALISAYPALHVFLEVAGATYLLWLAWKIATAKGLGSSQAPTRPQTFLQAAAFQWVNPKAWAMALGGIATYAPRENYVANIVVLALMFTLVNLPCVTGWTVFGAVLRRFLDRPKILRTFNIAMALLLAASLYPVAISLAARF